MLVASKKNYEIKRFGDDFYFVCKCGDRYERLGRRFMQVTDDGKIVPYKVWRPFRGWFPDEQKSSEN